jgi:hypothetical protein
MSNINFKQINLFDDEMNKILKRFESFVNTTQYLKIQNNYISSINNINIDLKKLAPRIDPKIRFLSDSAFNDIALSIEAVQRNDELMSGLKSMLDIQFDSLNKINFFIMTDELKALEDSLQSNHLISGLKEFSNSFNKLKIEVNNLAFIKFGLINKIKFPTGIKSLINDMNIGTAKKLSRDDKIIYNSKDQEFYTEENDGGSTILELNVISPSIDILSNIELSDLINFMNELNSNLLFANRHLVAQKIEECVANWHPIISLKQLDYFHGRVINEDACPYTNAELAKAPVNVTLNGRFNYPGQSFYYFSDALKGVIQELKKHYQNIENIQYIRFCPIVENPTRFVDLSINTENGKNKFLEYCRFPIDALVPNTLYKEYLIPMFFANTCKNHHIDGIQYYGSKEYTNFVTWNDSHFKFFESDKIRIER